MKTTPAEAFDVLANWLAIALLLMAVNLLLELLGFVVSSPAREALLAVAPWANRASLLATLYGTFRSVRANRAAARAGVVCSFRRRFFDSYTFETVKRAAGIAFFINLMVVPFLDIAANTTTQPADFYIKLPAFLLPAAYGLAYFYLVWIDRDGERVEELA